MDPNQNQNQGVLDPIDQQQEMPPQMKENPVLVFLKRIWPATERLIKVVLYAIFSFLKNSVQYIVSQIKNQ